VKPIEFGCRKPSKDTEATSDRSYKLPLKALKPLKRACIHCKDPQEEARRPTSEVVRKKKKNRNRGPEVIERPNNNNDSFRIINKKTAERLQSVAKQRLQVKKSH